MMLIIELKTLVVGERVFHVALRQTLPRYLYLYMLWSLLTGVIYYLITLSDMC